MRNGSCLRAGKSIYERGLRDRAESRSRSTSHNFTPSRNCFIRNSFAGSREWPRGPAPATRRIKPTDRTLSPPFSSDQYVCGPLHLLPRSFDRTVSASATNYSRLVDHLAGGLYLQAVSTRTQHRAARGIRKVVREASRNSVTLAVYYPNYCAPGGLASNYRNSLNW